MDEWLERWLADGKQIDLGLMVKLTPHRHGAEYQGYEDGARDFLRLLRMVESLPICSLGWSSKRRSLWQNEAEILAENVARGEAYEHAAEGGWITMLDDGPSILGEKDIFYYKFKYEWGLYATQLSAEFFRFHPNYNFTAEHMIALVDAITRWKRPQHLEFGPVDYFLNWHPLDRSRRGIRWVGWVPFALNPSDVPEAERVQPMNGGTLIATQMTFWQAFERHPLYSRDAIERAQEVEMRLNLLGVLPTAAELNAGTWGSLP